MRYPRTTRGLAAVVGCVAVGALGASGCGSDDDGGGSASSGGGGSKTLTVYSSLPLQGAARPQSAKLVNGIKLAVQQAGGKAGPYTIKYVSLDDSTPQAGTWTPEATSANARKAAQDDSAVAYIGEFNSGATAVSLPLLNDGGLAMVSPANSAVGLTQSGPGAEPGEPDKYYPTGERNYARIVPTDRLQGAGMAQLMKDRGCTAAWISNDKEVYGAGLAKNIHTAADSIGLDVAGNEGFDSKAPNYRSLAAQMNSAGADCFAYAGN